MGADASICDRHVTLFPGSKVVDFFLGFGAEAFVAGLSTVSVLRISFVFVDSFFCFFFGRSSTTVGFGAAEDSAVSVDGVVALGFAGV